MSSSSTDNIRLHLHERSLSEKTGRVHFLRFNHWGEFFMAFISAIYIEVTGYRNTAAEARWQSRPASANISFSEIRPLASPSPDILYDQITTRWRETYRYECLYRLGCGLFFLSEWVICLVPSQILPLTSAGSSRGAMA